MNATRETKRLDTRILVATLTSDGIAKLDAPTARRDRINAALWNAKRDTKQARQKVNLLKKQLEVVTTELWPLQKTRFPEL
jgi:hypothetical protein